MVKDDIEKAREIVKDRFREDALFNDLSGVYKVTNENMNDENYIRLLQDNDRILSVIGSGDQILNSILFGSRDIDAFDISRFPKYFLELKLAAIRCLSYEEFINFFYDRTSFNRKIFERVLNYTSKEAREFWEGVCKTKIFPINFNKFFPRDVYQSTLFAENTFLKKEREKAIEYNPYLDEANYKEMKRRIEGIHIKYLTGNVVNLGYIKDRTYDLVNLSNIWMYQEEISDPLHRRGESKFKNFITNLRLGEDGKVINYLFDYYPLSVSYRLASRKYLSDPNFSIQVVNQDDALLVYKKR